MAQSVGAGVSANDEAAALVSGAARSTYSTGQSLSPDERAILDSAAEMNGYDHASLLGQKKMSRPNRQAELVSHFRHSSRSEGAWAIVHSVGIRSKDKHMDGINEKDHSADSDAGGPWVSLPDSTRGTGVVNPPDAGTVSPIEWNPGFSFGLPGFSDRTFLNPTLRVVPNSTKRKATRKVHRAPDGYIARSRLSHTVTSPLNETQRGGLLHQPGLHSSILDPLGQQ